MTTRILQDSEYHKKLVPYLGWSEYAYLCSYKDNQWEDKGLIKHNDIKLSIASMGVQFGQSVFEGLKAYRSNNDNIYIFRLRDNYNRYVNSCLRLCIPAVTESNYFKTIETIVGLRSQWEQPMNSQYLYLRPIAAGTSTHIMPIPADEYYFCIFSAPFNVNEQSKYIKLSVSTDWGRTAINGLGFAKTSANYAHAFAPLQQVKNAGYDNILWLDSSTSTYVEESNTMNIFFYIDDYFVTPRINGNILPGITRSSVIEILSKQYGINVIERDIKISEVIDLIKTCRMQGIFTTSTALGIQYVKLLNYREEEFHLDTNNQLIKNIDKILFDIYTGKHDDFNWLTRIK